MVKKLRLLWDPYTSIHYRVVERSQFYCSLYVVPYLIKIHFYIILPCMHIYLSWSLAFRFSTNISNSKVVKGKEKYKITMYRMIRKS
jgi:hypothetical protein